MREQIRLECTVCKRRNYTTTKNKKVHSQRLEQIKYCSFCNKRTLHKETR